MKWNNVSIQCICIHVYVVVSIYPYLCKHVSIFVYLYPCINTGYGWQFWLACLSFLFLFFDPLHNLFETLGMVFWERQYFYGSTVCLKRIEIYEWHATTFDSDLQITRTFLNWLKLGKGFRLVYFILLW